MSRTLPRPDLAWLSAAFGAVSALGALLIGVVLGA
jgi:hypothetical protein